MLNRKQIHIIQEAHKELTVSWIKNFDRQWDEAVGAIKNSKIDIKNIRLAQKETEN